MAWHLATEAELERAAMSWFRILARMIAHRSRRVRCEATFEVFHLALD